MPKDYFDDTTQAPQPQAAERSIRNIPISVGRPAGQRGTAQPPQSNASRPIFQQHLNPQGGKGRRNVLIWLAALVGVIVLLALLIIPFLRGTTVTVTPRTHTVVFDEQAQYVAYPTGSDIPDGALVYSTVTKELTESTPVSASGSEKVEDYASGTLTVYNNHSTSPLRLIKNTRFETPDGKVYRIRSSITVPGKQGTSPGTITVTVYADQPGEAYNVGPIDKFTLPGLKTSAPEMFGNVYAQSSSSMAGGYVGDRPIVAEADLKAAQDGLKATLKQKAETEAAALSVSGVAFPQLMTVEYTEVSPQKQADGSVTVSERAVVSIPVFETLAFAKSLAVSNSADASQASITIPDTSTFSITVGEGYEPGKTILFNLTGSAAFLWDVDTAAFAKELAGTKKASFSNIVSSFESIDTADAYVRPFWRSSFPGDPEDIEVIVGGGQ